MALSKKKSEHNNLTLNEAVEILASGGVAAIPTETVYGLAAAIDAPEAVKKIFELKNRPFFDPLIVHVDSIEMAKLIVKDFPPLAAKLAEKYWPGPLTLVLPKMDSVNPMITSGLESVGVRMPQHPLALEVLRRLKHPLAAPSANQFKRTSPTEAAHVRSEFGQGFPILDGGPCEVGIESTVIGFNADFSEILVYRAGAITIEMLQEFAPCRLSPSPAAPGQLEQHYQPTLPLVLLITRPHLSIALYESLTRSLGIRDLHPSWMNLPDEPHLAARELYSQMRAAANRPFKNCILLPWSQDKQGGLWTAIYDRVRKASSLQV